MNHNNVLGHAEVQNQLAGCWCPSQEFQCNSGSVRCIDEYDLRGWHELHEWRLRQLLSSGCSLLHLPSAARPYEMTFIAGRL
jgi:hypothetical protein